MAIIPGRHLGPYEILPVFKKRYAENAQYSEIARGWSVSGTGAFRGPPIFLGLFDSKFNTIASVTSQEGPNLRPALLSQALLLRLWDELH